MTESDGSSTDLIVIDRFEEPVAVVETPAGMVDIPRSLLPKRARQGDHLKIINRSDGTLGYRVDRQATEQARASAAAALEQLNANDSGGDLRL